VTERRPPLSLVVSAPPDAAGVEAMLAAAVEEARGGAAVRVMLTDGGLALLPGPWPGRLRDAGVDASLCSRSARERRVDPLTVPESVRWSSLAAFLRDGGDDGRVWSAFP
jgi:hypothetical protein